MKTPAMTNQMKNLFRPPSFQSQTTPSRSRNHSLSQHRRSPKQQSFPLQQTSQLREYFDSSTSQSSGRTSSSFSSRSVTPPHGASPRSICAPPIAVPHSPLASTTSNGGRRTSPTGRNALSAPADSSKMCARSELTDPLASATLSSPTCQQTLQSDDTLQWMSDVVNLTEDRIIGPFDFHTARNVDPYNAKRRAVSERFRIADVTWTQLEARAPEMNVIVTDIHKRIDDPDAF